MSKWMKMILAANIGVMLLVFIAAAHAQRPQELDSKGAAYLRVNINPTNVPPMVNINPNGNVPRVNVNQEVHVAPAGCQNRQNFQTGIGRSILGPLVVTYLQLPPQSKATLKDENGSHSMNLAQAGQITTALFLRSGQGLYFDTDVVYSGCRPE
jgi:hypothetical protein